MKNKLFSLLSLHFGLAAVVAQPVITSQPQNQTNIAGTTAIFTVGATGTPTLFYQWRRNGPPLPSETNATLVVTNVQPPSPQNYSVVVSNAEGSVISTNARLFILVPPSITRQPASQSAAVGDAVAFTVSATGPAPLSYQWLFNDQALAGQTLTNLLLTSVQRSNAGPYSVVITNIAGSITSLVATLKIVPFNSIYCFGHSWTDTGRSPPSGPNYWQGRWSNGPLWPEYLSTNLGLAYDPARNFAVAGASSGDVLNLQIPQLSNPSNARSALFVVWPFEGDFAQTEFANPNLDQSVTNDALWNGVIRTMVQNTTNTLNALYSKGARSILIPSMEAYGATPGAPGVDPIYSASDTTRSNLNQWSASANVALAAALDDLDRSKPDLRILRLDFSMKFNQLLANYSDYGFTKVVPPAQFDPALLDKSINGPGTNYLWWDGRHGTTKTHGIWASWIHDLVTHASLERLGLTVTGNTAYFRLSKLNNGRDYTIQKSTGLSNWADVQTFTASAGTNQLSQTLSAEASSAFYRLQWQP